MLFIKYLQNLLVKKYVPLKFVLITLSNSSSVTFQKSFSQITPALFTNISILPYSLITFSIAEVQKSELEISPSIRLHLLPFSYI